MRRTRERKVEVVTRYEDGDVRSGWFTARSAESLVAMVLRIADPLPVQITVNGKAAYEREVGQ